MKVCVKTAVMPKDVTWGSPMRVDFSDQLSPGERVLAAMAGLGYFRHYYADNGSTSEAVGQMSTTLLTNLADDAVYVTGSLVMTNFDGAVVASSTDGSNHDSYARVTVVACVGQSISGNQVVAGNLYGLNGSLGDSIPVASSNAHSSAFLSGFSIGPDEAMEVSSLSLSSSVAPSTSSSVKVSGSASLAGEKTITGRADVAFLSSEGITSYRLMAIDTSASKWSNNGEEAGVSLNWSVTPDLGEGETVTSAGVLIQNIYIEFERDKKSDVERIEAGTTQDAPTIDASSGKISGTLKMNIFNARAGDDYGIEPPPTSGMTAYVIAQIESNGDEQ